MARVGKSIEVLEDSLSIEASGLVPSIHSRALAKRPKEDLLALAAYIPPPQRREGLLLDRDHLKNKDDLAGWEVRPNSFLSTCKLTIMVGSTITTAVPATRGCEDWRDMRSSYLQQKEAAISELHWETHRVLASALDALAGSKELETMEAEALYDFSTNMIKVLASLNKVVAPLLSYRMPRPTANVVSLPPTSETDAHEGLLTHWVISTVATVKKTISHCQRQAALLKSILEEAKEALDLAREGKEKEGVDDDEPDVQAAILYVEGDMPDSDRGTISISEKLQGYETFFVRRADFRACQELLDRVGEAQDSFDNRGKHKHGSVASNVMSAMRKVQNKTTKLGVHRISLMPNEFELVKRMTLFRGGLDSSDMIAEVASRLQPLLFSSSQCIIKAGTIGMGMYFVNTGACNVTVQGSPVAKLGYGDYFGEIALTASTLRTADVEAGGLCELFEFRREDLKTVALKYPILLKRLKGMAKQRVQRACHRKIELVEDGGGDIHAKESGPAVGLEDALNAVVGDEACLALFKSLFEGAESAGPAGRAWGEAVRCLHRVRCRAGELLISPDNTSNNLYIIERGTCDVSFSGVPLAPLHEGALVGTVTLLLSPETSAEVRTSSEEVELLMLKRSDLEDLMARYPNLYQQLMDVATWRSRQIIKMYEAAKGGDGGGGDTPMAEEKTE